PGMRRDDDQTPACREHSLHASQRRFLVGKMLEHADEQNDPKAIATIGAEFGRVAGEETQGRSAGVLSCARDHRRADIDADAKSDDLGEVKKRLPGAAAEVEGVWSMEVMAEHTEISNAGGK